MYSLWLACEFIYKYMVYSVRTSVARSFLSKTRLRLYKVNKTLSYRLRLIFRKGSRIRRDSVVFLYLSIPRLGCRRCGLSPLPARNVMHNGNPEI